MKYFSQLISCLSVVVLAVSAANSDRASSSRSVKHSSKRQPRFLFNIEHTFLIPEDEFKFTIEAADPQELESFEWLRYHLVLKFDNSPTYRAIPDASILQLGDSQLGAEFIVPHLAADDLKAPRKAMICLQDTRQSKMQMLTGKGIKGCSDEIRVAPMRSLSKQYADIEPAETDKDIRMVTARSGVFPQVPAYLKSNQKYELDFNLRSKKPYTEDQVEIYMKGDRKFQTTKVENQLITSDPENRAMFHVVFRTPELDMDSRTFQICIRLKGNVAFFGKRDRGCSQPIVVAEIGRGGAKIPQTFKPVFERELSSSDDEEIGGPIDGQYNEEN